MKKFIAFTLTMVMLLCGISVTESVTGKNLMSVSASAAASSYNASNAKSDLAVIKKHGTYLSKYRSTNKKTAVKALQRLLNWYLGETLEIDGIYGEKTRQAVLKLQKRAGGELTVDGCFGNECISYLQKKIDTISGSLSGNSSIPSAQEIYVSQYVFPSRYACTLTACLMLAKAYGYQNSMDVNSFTISEAWEKGWASGGCRGSFKINGVSLNTYGISNSRKLYNDPVKTASFLKRVLDKHPEGIVGYFWKSNTNAEHAVYISSDYSGGFKIIDPAGVAKYIPLSESANWISTNIGNCSQVWVVGELGV